MKAMIQITTTTGDHNIAERIAIELVDRRLAACVQISGPITSLYRWQGKVETTEEWICTAKTVKEQYSAIEQLITELHPYDTPELIATPIVQASAAYEAWLRGEVGV
jgi:periplasmic divalent cation tolerance protein